ncbi:dihydroxy-acid dehydratase, partial [Bacillus pumilus]|uniref:dihydroxy-acid dehydratase n=1 Tax=Bacillus pumilus TaxID=1408 RepID=UPI0021B1DAB6
MPLSNSYIHILPPHLHLHQFPNILKQAIPHPPPLPFQFNTIPVDHPIPMGHIPMTYSLP